MSTFVPVTDWNKAKQLYDAGLLWWDEDQNGYEWYNPDKFAFSRHQRNKDCYDCGVGYMVEE